MHPRALPRTSRSRRARAARSSRLVVTLAALVAVVVAAGCSPKYQATPRSWSLSVGTVGGAEVRSRAGLSPGVGILWESDADQTRDLDKIAATGAKWTTLDIDWNSIQGDGPQSFRWDRATDRAVLNMRAHGLTILGVAAYSPSWARGASCPRGELHCLPANPDDYARFMAAAAQRYGSRSSNPLLRGSITNWQIWNEPNHRPFAMPKPNLDAYTAMLKASYRSIKFTDPSATVVTGGTAPAPDAADGSDYQPETWLKGLYARGAKGSFDAVGHHPANYPSDPLEPHPWNAYTNTTRLHDVMALYGDGAKKVWGTEVAAPTGTSSQALTDALHARHVREYYLGWNTQLRGITGPLIWMPVRDAGTNPAAREDNMGLLRRDWSAKPAYTTFSLLMAAGV